MIKEIRKIKFEKLKKEWEEELTQLKLEIEQIEEFEGTIDKEKLSNEKDAISKELNKFFIKHFNKKKYAELTQLYINKMKISKKLFDGEYDIVNKRKKMDSISDEIERNRIYFEKLNLTDFGLDFVEAVSLLNEHGIESILTEEDKDIIDVASKRALEEHSSSAETGEINIGMMKEYVLVHKTKYCPNGNKINTRKEANVEFRVSLSLDKIGSLKCSMQRNTIHFAVNGEVGSHSYGNWDSCKYAIIIPFTKMPINQLRCGAVMDTYIENSLNLPNSAIILCPKEELEQVRKNNSNVKIIGYSGQNVSGYADSMVGILGYKVENIDCWSWENQIDKNKYYQDLKESNLNVHTIPHLASYEFIKELIMDKVNAFEALIDEIIDKKIVLSGNEVKSLKDEKQISLAGMFNNQNVKLQLEIFEEIIPFLEERKITISEKIISEIMNIASLLDIQRQEITYNKSFYDIEHKILELMNSNGSDNYNSNNDYKEYVNSILYQDIFEQINRKVMENQSQGKSL